MKWLELVFTRKEEDAEYARRLYQTQPVRVIEAMFGCKCGGPLAVAKEKQL